MVGRLPFSLNGMSLTTLVRSFIAFITFLYNATIPRLYHPPIRIESKSPLVVTAMVDPHMRLWHVASRHSRHTHVINWPKEMNFYFHSLVAIGTPDAFLVSESRIIYDTARKRKQFRRIVVCSVRKKCSLRRGSG